jgi:hypothetical protein
VKRPGIGKRRVQLISFLAPVAGVLQPSGLGLPALGRQLRLLLALKV